jgi:hypothetical protein
MAILAVLFNIVQQVAGGTDSRILYIGVKQIVRGIVNEDDKS